MRGVSRIAREEFVASIAAQRHGDALAREARQQEGRNQRPVAERFVQQSRYLRDDFEHLAFGESLLVMLGPQMIRDQTGVRRFIERFFLEGYREGFDAPFSGFAGERGDRARIYAS